jgi:hypothetical protein
MAPRLLIEECARLKIGSLFKSGRVGAGSSGKWRGQKWRIDGPFLLMSDRSWRLVPSARKNVLATQWLLLDATGRRCASLFMTPDGRVGTRWELGLRYRSQTLWTGKRLAHRRHKAIEKLVGRTDFKGVRDHPAYVPDRPKRMRRTTYRRIRKRLTTTPRSAPELDELISLMGQRPGDATCTSSGADDEITSLAPEVRMAIALSISDRVTACGC